MHKGLVNLILTCICSIATMAANAQRSEVEVWQTNADRSALFQQQASLHFGKNGQADSLAVIELSPGKRFQSIDGFGFALTGGSADHIVGMKAAARKKLLRQLFDTTGSAIGISYLRLSIGASDLNKKVFSYDDVEGDTALLHFDLGEDKENVVPVMKEILAINPHIKILGSPWSPPAWMKNNKDARGGRLLLKYYPVYARYLVKYIQAMAKNGINIDAITVQNEPLHPGNNPSLLLTAPEEADFIKYHLGPLFRRYNIRTKIILYDHNADRPDYPLYILKDRAAAPFVDGSGFHLYGGSMKALSYVHDQFPAKNIYFTEQMVVQYNDSSGALPKTIHIINPVTHLIMDAPRNWSRNVLLWNLAADALFRPYTDRGGCPSCQGAVTIESDSVSYNLAYYALAHASKFVRPGSVRIYSTQPDGLQNIAYTTPGGQRVLLVANTGVTDRSFNVSDGTNRVLASLPAKSVATYVWK